jgi:hypothetical protein
MAAKSTTSKKSTKSTKKSEPKNTRGSVTNPDLIIVKDVKTNPRKEGTWGFQSFSLIKSGMTVAKFVELGGRTTDLRWDIAKGHIHLTSK